MLRFLFRTPAHCPAAEPQAERDWVGDLFARFAARHGLDTAESVGAATPAQAARLLRRYSAAVRRAPSTISRLATGSGDTLKRIEAGQRITTERLASAVAWLAENWPADLDWPADVPRPDAGPARPAPTHRKEDPRC